MLVLVVVYSMLCASCYRYVLSSRSNIICILSSLVASPSCCPSPTSRGGHAFLKIINKRGVSKRRVKSQIVVNRNAAFSKFEIIRKE